MGIIELSVPLVEDIVQVRMSGPVTWGKMVIDKQDYQSIKVRRLESAQLQASVLCRAWRDSSGQVQATRVDVFDKPVDQITFSAKFTDGQVLWLPDDPRRINDPWALEELGLTIGEYASTKVQKLAEVA